MLSEEEEEEFEESMPLIRATLALAAASNCFPVTLHGYGAILVAATTLDSRYELGHRALSLRKDPKSASARPERAPVPYESAESKSVTPALAASLKAPAMPSSCEGS